eukprot:gene5698-7089_t
MSSEECCVITPTTETKDDIVNNKTKQNTGLIDYSDRKWETIVTLPTKMTLKSFWFTMERWSLNPQFMNKSVKKYIILSKTCYDENNTIKSEYEYPNNLSGVFVNDNDLNSNNNNNQDNSNSKEKTIGNKIIEDEDNEVGDDHLDNHIETIVYKRHLIPRLLNRDPELDEHIYHRKKLNTCEFYPQIPLPENARSLPFFYPKVVAISIIYDTDSIEVDTTPTTTTTDNNNNNVTTTSTTSTTTKNNNKKKPTKKSTTNEEEETIKANLKLKVIFFEEYKPLIENTCLKILEKIDRWGINYEVGYKKKAKLDSVVSKSDYLKTYEELKPKYKNWAVGWEEATGMDPQKFVFEDIALAAYLITIWKQENIELKRSADYRQSFVDLGCGNGFLVNLLIHEGYKGIGIDLRSRRVWEKYNTEVRSNLIEESVLPKDISYPEYDWIIGNHSDELTPWIPFIASKSEKQRFFLLPCCFFNFMSKFTQNDTRIGQYTTYLNYIENVIKECGFSAIKDTLRIPSTKNIAFVSSTRNPSLTEQQLNESREQLLKQSNYSEFKPREKEIKWVPQKRYRPDQYNPHLDNEKKKKLDEKEDVKEEDSNIQLQQKD